MSVAAKKQAETKTQSQPDITIDAWKIRAAMRFQAKIDVRYYLKGVCLLSDGRIAATDGHTMFACPIADPPIESTIIAIDGSFPKRAEKITFKFYDEKYGIALAYNTQNRVIKSLVFEVIKGKFPDIDKVIPSGEPCLDNGIPAFNPAYMARCAAALDCAGDRAVIPKFRGPDKVIELRSAVKPFDQAMILVMPMRV